MLPNTTLSIPCTRSAIPIAGGLNPGNTEMQLVPESGVSSSSEAFFLDSLIHPTPTITPVPLSREYEPLCTEQELLEAEQTLWTDPDLFSQLPRNTQQDLRLVRSFVTRHPERFFSLDRELQNTSEIRQTALIAARFFHNDEVIEEIQSTPELVELNFRMIRMEETECVDPQLWSLYSFAFYSEKSLNQEILTTYIPDEFKNSWSFAFHKIQQNGLLLEYFPAFQNNWRIAQAAIEQNIESIRFVSSELQNSYQFITSLPREILTNPSFLDALSPHIKSNPYFWSLLDEKSKKYIQDLSDLAELRQALLERSKINWTPADSE